MKKEFFGDGCTQPISGEFLGSFLLAPSNVHPEKAAQLLRSSRQAGLLKSKESLSKAQEAWDVQTAAPLFSKYPLVMTHIAIENHHL